MVVPALLMICIPVSYTHLDVYKRQKVFLTGENLFTFTGLDGGIDPEESNERGWSYSNVKKLSVGVKLSF